MIPSPPQLLAVLPVYNEEESVPEVIAEWFAMLGSGVGNFTLLAIDDGSTDSTPAILKSLVAELGDRLEIISRPNRGHGQTCIEGYRIAVERGIPYILQIDSDGQSDPSHFPAFWSIRSRHDVIYGKRTRHDGTRRILASAVLRVMLRIFAGTDCIDANVPYRLMNAKACRDAILSIPQEIHLANIALSVLLARDPAVNHGTVPISFPPRLGGEPSVPPYKFAAKGFEFFSQMGKAGLM